uniref:Uncharacterized protein n=1 Tax=Arundo donax TaxID=35708 RepID=A0A0A9DTD4_ARUDO
MDPAQPKGKRGRKEPKDFKSHFEVITELVNPKKRKYVLKLVKGDRVEGMERTYTTVCSKKERVDNKHAFYIMHNLYHKNILSMKALSRDKTESTDPLAAVAFVEPYSGLLWSVYEPKACVDYVNHIPSQRFQSAVREVFTGLDFIWQNGLYHGNLNWKSTLYHESTVKLAGFEEQAMSIEEAQWIDFLCFIRMLEDVSKRAISFNASIPEDDKHVHTNLDSLIATLRTVERTSLTKIKETILEEPFFWDFGKRTKFFANTVSLKLNDDNFMQKVRTSNLRAKPWDKNCTPQFRQLVQKMNDHRQKQKNEEQKAKNSGGQNDAQESGAYNGASLEHYVRCVCGAYTHWRQIKLNVDDIVRGNHPTIFIDMKRLIETSEGSTSGSGPT